MEEFAETAELISDVVGQSVTSDTRRVRKMESGRVLLKDLHCAGVVRSLSADECSVKFLSESDSERYAVSRWLVSHTDPVAVIDWIEVAEQYRRKGIGRTLREELIECLTKEVDEIYTNIIDAKWQEVAEEQGFEPVGCEKLRGYHVYQ